MSLALVSAVTGIAYVLLAAVSRYKWGRGPRPLDAVLSAAVAVIIGVVVDLLRWWL